MVENNPEDSNSPTSLTPGVAADLRARAERLSGRPLKSMTKYLAVSLNEQRHAHRIGRRLGLRDDEMEALVLWHSGNVLFHTRASRPPSARSGMTYGVTVWRLPQSRIARLLHSVRRSPAVGWLPSFTSNRIVELRAMYMRLTRYSGRP